MPVVDDVSRLRHILEAALKALEFTKGKRRSDLDNDAMLSLALVRLLEIIGEAAGGSLNGCALHIRELLGARCRRCATA